MNFIKEYVKVNADHNPDGTCRPLSVTLEDLKRYEIERVKDCRKAASTKVGGNGIRYTVIISGAETFLFYEGNGRWFVEKKVR